MSFNVEGAAAFEHHVDLVVGVGLLVVWLRGDEDVDTDLKSFRLVDDR
ncbi:MAG TPA: hypothetical protein VGU02_01875 [Gaiellaceae bacterium]|nr:hypothetical protein [Gaiellaceae bacterium]